VTAFIALVCYLIASVAAGLFFGAMVRVGRGPEE
jgi:hypothetical protein